MAENPTVGELLKAEVIASDEIDAAVDAWFEKSDVGPYKVSSGYLLDFAAAVRAHPFSNAVLSNDDLTGILDRAD